MKLRFWSGWRNGWGAYSEVGMENLFGGLFENLDRSQIALLVFGCLYVLACVLGLVRTVR